MYGRSLAEQPMRPTFDRPSVVSISSGDRIPIMACRPSEPVKLPAYVHSTHWGDSEPREIAGAVTNRRQTWQSRDRTGQGLRAHADSGARNRHGFDMHPAALLTSL